MTQFAAPAAGGDGVKLSDLLGHTIIAKPTAYEPSIATSFGDTDAVRVDVADLMTGEHHTDALWFPGYVVGALKGRIGELVLGQVAQGDPKPGQSPPWIIEDRSTDAATIAAAEKWLAANPGKLDTAFAAPATETADAPPADGPALGAF